MLSVKKTINREKKIQKQLSPKKIPKTNAKRQQEFRQRQKEKLQQNETLDLARKKANAERAKRYRDKLKLKKQCAELDLVLSSKEDSIPMDTSNTATEDESHIDIKEEPIIDIKEEPIIGIKQEPIIDIKQEPIDPLQEDSHLLNYECSTSQIVQKSVVYQNAMDIVKVEGIPKGYDENEQFRNDCLQFANFVGIELQKLSDYNSLEVAKQCIRSILLDAQNGVYKSGVLPQIVSMPTNSAVKLEPSE